MFNHADFAILSDRNGSGVSLVANHLISSGGEAPEDHAMADPTGGPTSAAQRDINHTLNAGIHTNTVLG